jgi:two-component system, NarL family, nitrate/nitrite response regulator NarL
MDAPAQFVRVLVADSSRIHTRLLADELKRDAALTVIPYESDSSGLVAAVMAQEIDVLVICSNLDGRPSLGIEVIRELRTVRPDTRAVVLLHSAKDDLVLEAFRAGARGLFDRNDPIEMLSTCVRCAYQGQVWANNQLLSVAIGALANMPAIRAVDAKGMDLLSEREFEVVGFLAEGLTNREIAERMKLSQHTVKNYLFRIFEKLGVSSRVELLFMTLSQASPVQTTTHPAVQANGYSHDEVDFLKKSAEAGLPAAQLALAQLHLTERNSCEDLVEAYKWYLLATERALQAREHIIKMMTSQQIDEAKERAAIWLARKKQPHPSVRPSLSPQKKAASGEQGYRGLHD